MRNYLFTPNQQGPTAPNEVLKATALIYLKDALKIQEFEQCPDLIQKALYFGALKSDIQQTIAEYIKGGKELPVIKPFQKGKGARRF